MLSVATFIVALVVFTPSCGVEVVSLWFVFSEVSGGVQEGFTWPSLPWAALGGGFMSPETLLGSGRASPIV